MLYFLLVVAVGSSWRAIYWYKKYQELAAAIKGAAK